MRCATAGAVCALGADVEPYTEPARDSFYYQYQKTQIRGIRQTHQPSPWIGDYATFALMPVSGKLANTVWSATLRTMRGRRVWEPLALRAG